MGMAFQGYAVWPHMTVYDNVASGLRLRRWARDAIRQVDYFVAVEGLTEPVRVQTTPPIAARPGEEVTLAFSVTDCALLED